MHYRSTSSQAWLERRSGGSLVPPVVTCLIYHLCHSNSNTSTSCWHNARTTVREREREAGGDCSKCGTMRTESLGLLSRRVPLVASPTTGESNALIQFTHATTPRVQVSQPGPMESTCSTVDAPAKAVRDFCVNLQIFQKLAAQFKSNAISVKQS